MLKVKDEKGEWIPITVLKGEKGDKGDDAVTDQTYNPVSANAQSGKAVAEALGTKPGIKTADGQTVFGVGNASVPYFDDVNLQPNKAQLVVGNGKYIKTNDYMPKEGVTYYTFNSDNNCFDEFEGIQFESGKDYYVLDRSNAFTVQEDGTAYLQKQGIHSNSVITKKSTEKIRKYIDDNISQCIRLPFIRQDNLESIFNKKPNTLQLPGLGETITLSKQFLTNPSSDASGIIAENWSGGCKITNSYAANTKISNFAEVNCTNVYATDCIGGEDAVSRTDTKMQGLNALKYTSEMANLAACGAFAATEGYPTLKIFPSKVILPVFPDATLGDIKVWEGNIIATSIGSGTEEDPYIIETPEEFAYMVYSGGKGNYYKLTKDIYLNDINKIDWITGVAESGYTPNSWYTSSDVAAFNGTIDGDGHIVYGLYMNTTEAVNSALFPRSQNNLSITIKNLGIESTYISTGGRAAGFVATDVGWINNTGTLKIENSYLGEDVTIKAPTAAAFYGYGDLSFLIDKCYTLAKITGTSKYGAVGNTWGSSRAISNAYIVNTWVSNHNSIPCTNVYATNISGGTAGAVKLTTDNMQGLDALINTAKMAGLAECDAFVATDDYPMLKSFPLEKKVKVWDGVTTTRPMNYTIETAEELAWVALNGGGGSYKLTKNIYLNDINKINWKTGEVTDGYVPNTWYKSVDVRTFWGSLDGDGHVIYGLYADTTDAVNVSLFPNVQDNNPGSFKNLGIEAAYISTGGNTSAFFAISNSSGVQGTINIENCYVGADVTLKGRKVSVFYTYGQHKVNIDKCYSLAKIVGTDSLSALLIYGDVSYCTILELDDDEKTDGATPRFLYSNIYKIERDNLTSKDNDDVRETIHITNLGTLSDIICSELSNKVQNLENRLTAIQNELVGGGNV